MLDPSAAGPIEEAIVSLDERGRLQLPLKIIKGLDWIDFEKPCDALTVLRTPGLARLYPWEHLGERVVTRRRELIQRAITDETALDALKALEERYKRVRIPVGGRPTLPMEVLEHLGVSIHSSTMIYVWKIVNVLQLNSTAQRIASLEKEWAELEGLP